MADIGTSTKSVHFNSTMVRLKATKLVCSALKQSDFNSTMVRLKDLHDPSVISSQIDFNSTMVRLKAAYFLLAKKKRRISIPLWFG